jgi:hypothetical protein
VPGAESSWGNSTWITQRNLSECVVDGSAAAICLGIPSHPTIAPNSLGHHAGWMILDKDSAHPKSLAKLKVGDKGCLTYRLLLSSNFDLRTGINAKFPGLASSPDGVLPPNDHICELGDNGGYERVYNRGDRFANRVTVNGQGGSATSANSKLLGHFKDDMLDVPCSTRPRYFAPGFAQDPLVGELKRGIWYRAEQELVLNTNYNAAPGQRSGAKNRIWIYHDKTGALMTSYGIADSFLFEGVAYPLMPRRDATGKVNGMFVSMMQTATDPSFVRNFAIAVRGFELHLK